MSGTVCVTDRRKELEEQFVDGEEIMFFNSEDDIAEIVKSLLADEAACKRIAENGKNRVLAKHTFENRMRTVIEACSKG